MQLEIKNSPFTEEQIKLLNNLLPKLSASQQVWLSGYLTALSNAALQIPEQQIKTDSSAINEKLEVTILYGSQTGNGEGLATELSKKLENQGYEVTLVSTDEFKHNSLKKLHYLLLIVSTHGEGDPPDTAMLFYEFLNSKRAPKLADLHYSVLSLGDSSYEFFCQTGKEFDERLQQLGATRLCPRVDCDLDYDEPAAAWFERVINALSERQSASVPSPIVVETVEQAQTYSRKNPYHAEIIQNINLNGRGSNKETRHIELSLEGSNLQFEPGDSLGIYPENNPLLVDAIMEQMGWNQEELVPINSQSEEKTLQDALRNHLEITVLTKPLLEKALPFSRQPSELKELVKNDQAVRDYLYGRDLLDFIRDFSLTDVPASEFITILRKLPARLYSVASSLKANPEEAHLTIGKVAYHTHGRDRFGVCSVQCSERLQEGDTVPVYVHRNSNFKLPSNPDTPIIMIGPGTGIAPYRAFLQEREETGAQGKSWLFFGDQHYVTDFLYQVEWQRWLKQGVLSRIDLAFSRDTDKKIYVQHRMQEKSKELYEWVEEGAVVYVCGDEKHMAKDVHHTLTTIVMDEGGMDEEAAKEYVANMQKEKRYLRDVY